jgi:hypothetical protein
MVTRLSPETLDIRSYEFINSWRQHAPELTLAGRTLVQFEAEKLVPAEVQLRMDVAKTEYKGCVRERQTARKQLQEILLMLANAVRSTPELGPDSPFYRSLGFIPTSERKRRSMKQTEAVAAVPATPTANVV